MRDNDEGRQKRANSSTNIAAHLKQRLRGSISPTRRKTSDARSFGVKNGRTHTDQHRTDDEEPV